MPLDVQGCTRVTIEKEKSLKMAVGLWPADMKPIINMKFASSPRGRRRWAIF